MSEQRWVLTGVGRRLLRLTARQAGGGAATTVSPVFTMGEVCRALRKSRRHVYRYLHTGRLRPCARVLGQWLFAKAEVDRLARGHLPRALRGFFWDTRLSNLSIDHHRDFILARLLEFGDRNALHWVFQTYPRDALTAFLRGRGADLLTRRTWQFWALQVGLPSTRRVSPSWRSRGRAWGGCR